MVLAAITISAPLRIVVLPIMTSLRIKNILMNAAGININPAKYRLPRPRPSGKLITSIMFIIAEQIKINTTANETFFCLFKTIMRV